MGDGSASDSLPSLPVMLRVQGQRCVVVGGGAVAARRAASLVAYGAEVVVVAPAMDPKLDELLIERAERGYEAGDLDGAFLVVIATDNAEVNQQVADDAAEAGVLINRTDDAGAGDLTVMAHERQGPLTVAVDTGNTSAAATKAIRAELLEALDDDWITLLTEARPWRARIQASVPEDAERAQRLRRLADDTAMQTLKQQGVSALRARLQAVAEGRADD
ncbi:MAG: bifunctional precorrin-2 dehydrogenase/sirohydrochlorin ferrochelatase [Planctomycetota bacterium]